MVSWLSSCRRDVRRRAEGRNCLPWSPSPSLSPSFGLDSGPGVTQLLWCSRRQHPEGMTDQKVGSPGSQDDFMIYSCPSSLDLQAPYYKVWEEQTSIFFKPLCFFFVYYSCLVLTLINAISISLFVRLGSHFFLIDLLRVLLQDVYKCSETVKCYHNVSFYCFRHSWCICETTRPGARRRKGWSWVPIIKSLEGHEVFLLADLLILLRKMGGYEERRVMAKCTAFGFWLPGFKFRFCHLLSSGY